MNSPTHRFRLVALALALAAVPTHAAQRAFVSSTGNDANAPSGCTPAAPCRSFQAAHGAVDANGEIVALDTAGFGTIVITKSVTILGNPGTVPSIAVASGTGVAIATAGVNVTLRNLNINGVGGQTGIDFTAGDSLTIENCVVSNFTGRGVAIRATNSTPVVRIAHSTLRRNQSGVFIADSANVDVSNSQMTGNTIYGLYVEHLAGATADVAVNDSVSSGNGLGFLNYAANGAARMSLIRVTASNNTATGIYNWAEAGGNAVVTVGSSMVTQNGNGYINEVSGGATATFETLGNNILRHNGLDTLGTITTIAGN